MTCRFSGVVRRVSDDRDFFRNAAAWCDFNKTLKLSTNP